MLLRLPFARMASCDDNQVVQTDDRDKGAQRNCWKILQPESDFSPTIQMWYDRIHTYLQLIHLQEGKAKNVGNILRFARRQHIPHPE